MRFQRAYLRSYGADVRDKHHFEHHAAKEQNHANDAHQRNDGPAVSAEPGRTGDSDDGNADQEQERHAVEPKDDERCRAASRTRSRPAEDARPSEPPTAQNRCRPANAAHHNIAQSAGQLDRAKAERSTPRQLAKPNNGSGQGSLSDAGVPCMVASAGWLEVGRRAIIESWSMASSSGLK